MNGLMLAGLIVAYSARFADEILDQLAELDGLTSRRMFGALGLYYGGAIFALIAGDALYLRLDQASFETLRGLGGKPLKPVSRRPDLQSARYVSVPLEVLENRDELLGWVRRATG